MNPLTEPASAPNGRDRRWRVALLVAMSVAVAAAAVLAPAVPQPAEYHDFADARAVLGLPHALNVLSNVAFLAAGLAGMVFVARRPGAFIDPRERLPWGVFFLTVALVCLGSVWYHASPDNARLAWDRFPMAAGFMALFAALVAERVSPAWGARLLLPLVAVGVGTVVYWAWSEARGAGNVMPYVAVQFYGLLALPLLVALFPARYTRSGDLLTAVLLYAASKAAEALDRQIWAVGELVSGHTLKHLLAALAIFWVLRMLRLRRPIDRA